MKKLAGESLNIMEENLAAMQQIFPEAFEEGKIDFDVLRQLLGDYVDDEEERYSFRWNGKGKALRLSQTPSTGTLRPCKEESKDWDTTENLYIEGDNLEVLKLLQKSYHGRVKMIYIDPPYNTGKDFVYKDDFRDNVANYKRITGQVDDEGHWKSANKENRDSSGRFHTDWLNMMYPRLRMARNLLSDDGVIFISIDDNEQDNLKKICDEVFGEGNFVATIIREAIRGGSLSKNIKQVHDYVLCYAKGIEHISFGGIVQEGIILDCEDEYGKYVKGRELNKWGADSRREDSPSMYYPIPGPNGEDVFPIRNDGSEGRWRLGKEKMFALLEAGNAIFSQRENGTYIVYEKIRDNEHKIKQFITLFNNDYVNARGTEEIKSLFNTERANFDFSKPKELIFSFLIMATGCDDIILDFFAGSSTTAHAVIQRNAEDGGKRKFIMVQLPEPTIETSEAAKAGYENICEIGKERIRRAGEKIKAECEDAERAASLDIGFKVFKLDSSNLQKWQPQPEDLLASLQESMDNFLPDRTNLDVVYEIALKLGLDLSYEVEEREADGQTIYIIGAGALMICLASQISMETAEALLKLHEEYEPETWQVVFRDTGFLSDQEKTNIKETLKSAGLDEDAFISI